jgi:hypothetical protein
MIKIEHKQLVLPRQPIDDDEARKLAFWNSETRNRARVAEAELSIMACRHHPDFANVIRYTATLLFHPRNLIHCIPSRFIQNVNVLLGVTHRCMTEEL